MYWQAVVRIGCGCAGIAETLVQCQIEWVVAQHGYCRLAIADGASAAVAVEEIPDNIRIAGPGPYGPWNFAAVNTTDPEVAVVCIG